MVDLKKVKMGKRSKAQGAAFELRVRKDLEEKGWVCDKWSNNVEFTEELILPDPDPEYCELGAGARAKNPGINKVHNHKVPEMIGKLIPAKAKWAGPNRPMMMGAGFPDFIAFVNEDRIFRTDSFEKHCVNTTIIGVECKMTGKLDKEEKEKCAWLLNNNIFSKILIAEKTKVKNKIVIIYHDFGVKYEKSTK